jgi:hypothetical protein
LRCRAASLASSVQNLTQNIQNLQVRQSPDHVYLPTNQGIKQGNNTFIAFPTTKTQILPLFRFEISKICKSSKVRALITYVTKTPTKQKICSLHSPTPITQTLPLFQLKTPKTCKSGPWLPTPSVSYYKPNFTIVFRVTKNIDFAFIPNQNSSKIASPPKSGPLSPTKYPRKKFTLPASPAP